MNLANILTRKTPMKRAFIALESDMDDVLNEEFMLPPQALAELDGSGEWLERAPAENDDRPFEDMSASENGERLTPHSQNRLADLAAFNDARNTTQQQLDEIGAALANIVSFHHQSRDFVNDCHADIRRANEFEILSGSLAAENRKLTDRVEKLDKLRGRYDQLIEVLKRRESKLLVEAETLRETLGSAKLEAVEARNTISRAEFVQGELHTALAAKTSEAERLMRENELLREKNVNIALDLDKALQRQSETRRKFEDLSAIHTAESTMVAKTTAKLASEEKEAARLQKLSDALESKLVEANEHVTNLTREMTEREELYQSENHALRGEIQTLISRLHAGASGQSESVAEMTALKARLNELESEKLFTERKSAGLRLEMEDARVQQAKAHEQQLNDMRQRIEDQARTIDGLRQNEKAAAESKNGARFPETFNGRAKSAAAPRSRPSASA